MHFIANFIAFLAV